MGLTWDTRFMTRERIEIDSGVRKKQNEKNYLEDVTASQDFNEVVDESTQSWLKRSLLLFCGLNKASTSPGSEQATAPLMSIKEKKTPTLIVDAACLLMLCVCVFLFGYYG